MGIIYVVRHGRASFSADDYDPLSELGAEQARLLGATLAARGVRPDHVVCGGLRSPSADCRGQPARTGRCGTVAHRPRAPSDCIAPLSWTQKVAAAGMRERGGAVINVTSVAGLKPAPGIGFYGASKAMLSYLTMELAVELAPQIRVNAVAPALVKTKFAAALYEGREEQLAATYPLGRLGQPEDIGSAVAFLVSSESSWMTGQTLIIDDGLGLTGGV